MKKLVLVLMLVAMLMSLTMTIAWAEGWDGDPPPGYFKANENGKVPVFAFPGGGNSTSNPGKASDNWYPPGPGK